jgi:hypothetical protein
MLIYPELSVILIGFGADIVAITNFFKKFAEQDVGNESNQGVTSTFYYNCVLYTCLIITAGQFGVGVWFIVAGLTELAMTLITSAILMTTLSVFIKRQETQSQSENSSSKEPKKPAAAGSLVPVSSTTNLVGLPKLDLTKVLVEKE